jgi:cytoskeletal protein CcmA (bactofilin family)
VRLGGVIEGEIEATGDVEIDEVAKVTASVAGRDVSIRGHVNGAVVARKRLVVARSGSLVGDVRVQRLVIQDGASFSGKVSMGAAAAEAPTAPPPAKPVVEEPEVPVMVEAQAPKVAAPVATAPTASKDGSDERVGKVGKVKAMPPKAKPKPKRR